MRIAVLEAESGRGLAQALRVAVVPAGLALGLYAEWAALRRGPFEEPTSGAEIRLALADLVVGFLFLGCGLVAWTRRPQSRTGLLFMLTGLTWFLGTFAASGESGYASFGALFLTLHRGLLVHALLSYPSGRLEHLPERAAVTFTYAVAAIAAVGKTPEAGILVAVSVTAASTQRFVAAAGPLRRARAAAAAASVAFAIVLLLSGVTRFGGSNASLDRGVLWAYQVVLAAIAIGLTLDFMLGRWVRAVVTGLVVDLGDAARAGALRDRLALALGDRSLVLGYRLAGRDVYVDDRGREVELPKEGGDRRVTIVRDREEPVAALVHDADVLTSPDLVQSVAAAARLAVVNARLQADVLRQVGELQASRRRLVEAADEERRRLESELRDGAERRLAEVAALLEDARRHARATTLAATVGETTLKLERTRSALLEFARGVHPRILTDGGLPAALRELSNQAALPVDLHVADDRYPEPLEAAVYFVCSEALANIGKYAAASRATVRVAVRNRMLVVTVSDDGKGGASLEKGSGLRGLADRVDALGGRLTVTSAAGEGTQVVAELPLA
jgi:signal transduction histidine kinase